MALLVGLDEAGYGPVLGPLVVAAAALRLPERRAADDLWRLLAPGVAREPDAPATQVLIADSKTLHRGPRALQRLERSVLATCPLPLPAPSRAFLQWLNVPEEHLAHGEPWHAAPLPQLPLAADVAEIGQLRRTFAATLRGLSLIHI